MFDFVGSELLLIGIVSLILIGPKDMPVAIRTVTGLIKKARAMVAEFQGHFDEMVKEADLEEARDQWRELRKVNIKNKILNTLDQDGSLQQTFKNNPLQQNTILPEQPKEETIRYYPQPVSKPMAAGLASQISGDIPDTMPGYKKKLGVDEDSDYSGGMQQSYSSFSEIQKNLDKEDVLSQEKEDVYFKDAHESQSLYQQDPAPAFIPPLQAAALQKQRAAPLPPAFIPPLQAAFIQDFIPTGQQPS